MVLELDQKTGLAGCRIGGADDRARIVLYAEAGIVDLVALEASPGIGIFECIRAARAGTFGSGSGRERRMEDCDLRLRCFSKDTRANTRQDASQDRRGSDQKSFFHFFEPSALYRPRSVPSPPP